LISSFSCDKFSPGCRGAEIAENCERFVVSTKRKFLSFCFLDTPENLYKYFNRKTSKGCLLVEKEHGPDEFIRDLRNDIFERFSKLIATVRE